MNAVHPVLPPIGGDKGSRGGGGGMLPPIGGDKGSRGGSGGGLNGDRRVSAGGSSGSFPTTARERRMSTIQVVKMGKSTRNMMNKPVVMLPDAAAMSADITEELRNTAPNMGRDVIAISTTATPVQVSMSPQEEMMNHAHLEKALKNKGDNTIRDSESVKEEVKHWLLEKQYIMHPHGRVRLRWDVACIVLIFYNAFVIPYQVSFEKTAADSAWSVTVDYCIDAFFGVDIVANFFTGVDMKGKVYFDMATIAKRYFSTWFVVDFSSTFPFTQVLAAQDEQLGKILRLFRLVRLLRLFRMIRILNRLQHALLIRSTISSLFRYCLTVVFISHWFACFFFWVSYQDSTSMEPPVNTWLKEKSLFSATIADQYVAALYWAIMTLATVGYGDVSAISTNERLFAIFAMFAGAGIFAYGITNIVALVSSLTAHETAFREKMDEINEYMAARDLPRQLRIEIREFFQNARKSKENDMLQEQELLNELSAMLRSKIALAINDHFLWKFPFFKGSDPNFIMDLALSMRMICFAPFEDVCVEGELGHEMFFIFRGAVEVLKDGIQLTVLGENQYFGEMAILNKDCKRMATVRTLCFCELRMLSRVRFLEALVHFPKMMQKLANYSKARAQAKNNLGTPQSTQRDSTDDDTRVVGRKNSKPKNPSYRLNWKSSIEPDHEGLSGFGMHSGGIGAEAVLQLDRIKRVQEVLTGKVRDLHSMMDSMLSTQAADESPPRSEQTT
ncbi:hypothetical protein H257_16591 [Aphanomyces astaci]|uniref:Cyclic nucleotide-binding domain-containing protein n=1 Tax=Aphanomyces astaci TaxID=112090 RepID=W4FI83_APHAT|nr:hypothetical protein H257_16591 [Aphanomyces astaci]ETV67217.1 hypothetical protein H257_16591 [Aphanomyces astaci]|eukprot:XP_009843382.1 hypothetical protein H257_16591 [Aphanomyces astaci]